MKKFIIAVALLTVSFAHSEEKDFDIDTLSEAFGNFLGKSFSDKNKEFPLNFEKVIEGMRKGKMGEPSPMTEMEYQHAVTSFQREIKGKLANSNLVQAEEFMKKNGSQQGIDTIIANKLHYQLIEPGEGSTVTENSAPLIHYKGSFIDGSIFGSSEETGPISIPLSGSIPGFRMGLTGMKEGEKRRLYIHPDFAYGTEGALPPNSLLIFDVEVIKADANQEEHASADS